MRFKTQKAKKGYINAIVVLMISLTGWLAVGVSSPAAEGHRYRHHHAPGCNTHKCDAWAFKEWQKHHPFTGYVVEGKISVFGGQTTADEGSASRPCIAIREDRTLGHNFKVSVEDANGHWHVAVLLHCDYGPAAWTGRSIDITEAGAEKLGLSVAGFPTDHYGVARELR